jgi:YidC/Oxa1 family membrane protein insertase
VDGVPSLGWPATIAFLTIPVILIVTQTISQNLLSPPSTDDPQVCRTPLT